MHKYIMQTLSITIYILFASYYMPNALLQSSENYNNQVTKTTKTGLKHCAQNEEKKQISSNSQNVSSSDGINSATEQVQSQKILEKKEIESPIPVAMQYCRGKYKKLADSGFEIITVSCPDVTSKCECEIDMKNFTEYINCGGTRKNASRGSEIRECESIIVGN